MHEFLLYSQVPAARESQVVSILAGVTGNQPVHIAEQTLLYAQLKLEAQAVSKKLAAAGKAAPVQQQQRPQFHKLVRTVDLSSHGEDTPESWTFRAEDVPEPGTKDCISRGVNEHRATETDLQRFANGTLYKYQDQFCMVGYRFVHSNIVVRVYRMMVQKSPRETQISPPGPNPREEEYKRLDESGSMVVEAVIRIDTGSSAKLREIATKELAAFKNEMEGAVDFRVPDRLAMDTRIKGA